MTMTLDRREVARLTVSAGLSPSSLLTLVRMSVVSQRHYSARQLRHLQFLVPRLFWESLVDEMEPEYVDSPFGDLSATFRRYARLYGGLTHANIPVDIDEQLHDFVVLDEPVSWVGRS